MHGQVVCLGKFYILIDLSDDGDDDLLEQIFLGDGQSNGGTNEMRFMILTFRYEHRT